MTAVSVGNVLPLEGFESERCPKYCRRPPAGSRTKCSRRRRRGRCHEPKRLRRLREVEQVRIQQRHQADAVPTGFPSEPEQTTRGNENKRVKHETVAVEFPCFDAANEGRERGSRAESVGLAVLFAVYHPEAMRVGLIRL
jgi:hypothetical protein